MKVSHFNSFPFGGAATAASRIHHQLLQSGTDSQFCYFNNEKQVETDPSFRQIDFVSEPRLRWNQVVPRRDARLRRREIWRQYNDHLEHRPAGFDSFSMAEQTVPTRLPWPSVESDVVHLHWLSFFVDYPSFFQSIPSHVPIVWTLHDMNPFTGGCHYSDQCLQFRFGCGDCRQVANPKTDDVSRHTLAVKQKSLENRNLHVVAPSEWLIELAKQSPCWPQETTFQTIRYGLDLDAFHPIDKLDARRQLGLSSDSVLIAFGAEDITSRRKGLQHLLSALKIISAQQDESSVKLECLLFGAGQIQDKSNLPPIHSLGYLETPQQQSLVYSAADMVVVPSREDNQPQVGLEAMACGTPVIGFDAGGISEYVRDAETGLIARLGNESQLAERISWLAEHHTFRQQYGRQARQMMEREFASETQAQNYRQLYEQITRSQYRLAG